MHVHVAVGYLHLCILQAAVPDMKSSILRRIIAQWSGKFTIPFPQCRGFQQTLYYELCRQLDLQCRQTLQPTSVLFPDRWWSLNPRQPSWKTSAVRPSDNRSTREQLLAIMDDDSGSLDGLKQALPAHVLIYIAGQVCQPCPRRELLTGIMNTTASLA